jgi:hypothetical protein
VGKITVIIERMIFGEYFDEFTVKGGKQTREIKALLETGFEYVCQKDDLMFFRKRR